MLINQLPEAFQPDTAQPVPSVYTHMQVIPTPYKSTHVIITKLSSSCAASILFEIFILKEMYYFHFTPPYIHSHFWCEAQTLRQSFRT